jgi:uncharacterized protein (TIGR03435 family)
MHAASGFIPAVLFSLAAFAQSPAPRVEFEVASVKPSPPPGPDSLAVGIHIDGAMVRCTSFSLKDYIALAYRVKNYQISGPEWIASERFDIAAKLPAGAAREQIRDMVQTLLLDRFQLKLHHETKEFPVYALVVGKGGPKMKESAQDTATDGAGAGAGRGNIDVIAGGGRGGGGVDLGNGSSFVMRENGFDAVKLGMTSFADMLARFVDRPMVDMTDLKGAYDFSLQFSPEDFRAMRIRAALAAGVSVPISPEIMRAVMEAASGDSLFAAIESLGLKLDARKAPLDVLVIDHIEKTPSEN